MPLYEYVCQNCGKQLEVFASMDAKAPVCCDGFMNRQYNLDAIKIKLGYPGWIDRIDDIHKAQEQRGERLRFVHPREVRAS